MEDSIAVLVGTRGKGSNMEAIIRAANSGVFPARVVLVISSSAEAQALSTAQALGVPTQVVPFGDNYGERLVASLQAAGTTLVCLAGYMRLLPAEVLSQFPDRVLNIHPALLPKFGGKGMYGMHVHEAVVAAGEKESGCSVHLVSDKYDEGPLILQKRVPVLPTDDAETLAARVLKSEHQAYPEAIRKVLLG